MRDGGPRAQPRARSSCTARPRAHWHGRGRGTAEGTQHQARGAMEQRPSGSCPVGPWSASARHVRHRRCRRTEGSLACVARTLAGGPSSLPLRRRRHTLADPRTLSVVVLAHIGGPVGFVGTWRVGSLRIRAASLAIGLALVVPGPGLAATPALSASAGPTSGTSIPDLASSDARAASGHAWIVILKPGALGAAGTDAATSFDTATGRAAARGRASGGPRHRPACPSGWFPSHLPVCMGAPGLRGQADSEPGARVAAPILPWREWCRTPWSR